MCFPGGWPADGRAGRELPLTRFCSPLRDRSTNPRFEHCVCRMHSLPILAVTTLGTPVPHACRRALTGSILALGARGLPVGIYGNARQSCPTPACRRQGDPLTGHPVL